MVQSLPIAGERYPAPPPLVPLALSIAREFYCSLAGTEMSSDSPRPVHTRSAALFASYESAFQRMPKRERLRADQLTDRARHLLVDRPGSIPGETHAGFAHVGFGLFAQHTCFVDGGAALLSLSQGTAVAVRRMGEGISEAVGRGPVNGSRCRAKDTILRRQCGCGSFRPSGTWLLARPMVCR